MPAAIASTSSTLPQPPIAWAILSTNLIPFSTQPNTVFSTPITSFVFRTRIFSSSLTPLIRSENSCSISTKGSRMEPSSFSTMTAGFKNVDPAAALRSDSSDCRLPSWFVHVSDSLAACPSAPDAALASSTIFSSVSCFCASSRSLNDLL